MVNWPTICNVVGRISFCGVLNVDWRKKIKKTLISAFGSTLPINKRFLLKVLTPQNASKIAIFLWKENPKLLFPFLILCYFIFSPNECPGLCRHRPGSRTFIREKYKVAQYKKWKKQLWVFFCQKYSKFWSISLELFVEHKPSIWEEWLSKGKSLDSHQSRIHSFF